MNKKLLALSTAILMTLTLVMVPGFALLPPPPGPPGREPEIAVKIDGDWVHTLPPTWAYCQAIPADGPVMWPDGKARDFEPFELKAPAFCTTFNVEIWLLNVTKLYSYEFRLAWNYGFLNLKSYSLVAIGDGMGEQQVVDIDPVTPGEQPVFVQVWTHLGAVEGFTGSAKVADLVFHVNQDPSWHDNFYSAIYIYFVEASGPTTNKIPLTVEQAIVRLLSVPPTASTSPEDLIIVSAQDKQIEISVGVEDIVKLKSFDLWFRWSLVGITACDGVWDANWAIYLKAADKAAGTETVSLHAANDDLYLYLGINTTAQMNAGWAYVDVDWGNDGTFEVTGLYPGCYIDNVGAYDQAEWTPITIPTASAPPSKVGVVVHVFDGAAWQATAEICFWLKGDQLILDLQKHPIEVTDFLPGPYSSYIVDVFDDRVHVVVQRDCEKPGINGTGTLVKFTLTSQSPWGYKVTSIPELCYEKERKVVPPYFWYDGYCGSEVIHMWMPDECDCFITTTLVVDYIRCYQDYSPENHAPGPYMGYYPSIWVTSSMWHTAYPTWMALPVAPILYDFRPISGDFDMSGHVGLEDLMAIAEWYGAPTAIISDLIAKGVPPLTAVGKVLGPTGYWTVCVSDFDIVTAANSVGEIDIFDLTAVAKQFCKIKPFLWPGEEDYFIDP